MLTIDLHSGARAEFLEAVRWYASNSESAATRFKQQIQSNVLEIADAPLRCPEYLYGTRMRVAKPFPYLIVYRLVGDVVQIIAIAHGRRRPGYWKSRVYGQPGTP